MSQAGKFISLEGGEGVGKSTQLRALAAALAERGIDCLTTREPGGSEVAEAIRALLLGGDADRWSIRSEALLFAAARADHVEKTIRPALEQGRWVICDRFIDSSLAYQGEAGSLGIEAVRTINMFAIGDCLPDRTILLSLTGGDERAQARDGGASDRIGGRDADYHASVAIGFLKRLCDDPDRIHIVDASGPPHEVTTRVLRELQDLLP
ncbi:MAG: dTMP kinase [Sphingomicrobium sp.]